LFADAAKESDEQKRMHLRERAAQILMDHVPIIPIYYYVSKNLVSTNVKGWEPNAKDIQRTRYLKLEP